MTLKIIPYIHSDRLFILTVVGLLISNVHLYFGGKDFTVIFGIPLIGTFAFKGVHKASNVNKYVF